MSDHEERRDPGEFYPGGKVWKVPGYSGTAQGDVCHEDFNGVEDLENATLKQVGSKVNELITILKGPNR